MSEPVNSTPREATAGGGERRHWRSLEELAREPEFMASLEREFPRGASEMTSAFSRRAFLGLMAASAALAGGVACRRPEVEALPYTKAPERMLPGVPQFYATSVERASGDPIGVIVTCHEGRPVKIEGNPEHPASLGAVDPITQAMILELYDPDRSQRVLKDGQPSTLEEFAKFAESHFKALRARQGEGLAFLSQRTTSPTLRAQRERILKTTFPKARWHEWEPVNHDNAIEGMQAVFEQSAIPVHDFSKADVIVALDCDFLAFGPQRLAAARAFAARRRPEPAAGEMNRLYAVEPVFSLTGAAADHRLTLPCGRIREFARTLAVRLNLAQGRAGRHAFESPWIDALVEDLKGHRGRVAVLAGDRQPPEVHALAGLINAALGGECVRYMPVPPAAPCLESVRSLIQSIKAGRVDTLVMIGGNPAYDGPADLDCPAVLQQVKTAVHLSLYCNETSQLCPWHLPRAHALESWGDTQTAEGTVGLAQPLIAPLYGGMADTELLALLAGETQRRAYDIVRAQHQGATPLAEFEALWRKALHDGVLPGRREETSLKPHSAQKALSQSDPEAGKHADSPFELVLMPHPYLHDGSRANNGWLQETPEPITKLSWDNAALLSPAAAARLKIGNEDTVKIEAADGRAVELPVWIVPGMDDATVAVHLGYGRTAAGRVGDRRGVNVYPLMTTAYLNGARGIKLTPLGRRMALATMQHFGAMGGRPLVREMTREEFLGHPDRVHGHEEKGHSNESSALWQLPLDPKQDPQWAMAIDLSACIGCQGCVVACQAENNIPIVGKEQIAKGRIMQWLRVDRYFSGTVDQPGMVFQPLPCQQCETAPCEQVCPVGATVHSPDGLNEMTYNRCVGTRYCSNNCPYKVRRFNFFNYRKGMMAVEKMAMNPDVTVRMRGVMEKCSYCVQRIVRGRVAANGEGRSLRDGEVMTACQQACPTGAIVFGNQADPHSAVAKQKANSRNYLLLGELNTRPRTSYLAKVSNPNERLAVKKRHSAIHQEPETKP